MRDLAEDRWRAAGALFHELVELDESSRSERLARLGDSDPELRDAVEALLAGDAMADDALPTPGFGLGAVTEPDVGDALGIAGQTLGRFRVLEQIAWGGMGVVYRAEDLQLRRTIALKFPLFDRGVTDSARETTLREARSAGALDHPNLCPVYDVGESAQGPFFVMPLYDGETLKRRILRAAPLSVGEALAIMEQLAAGLACAHAAGIVHCDIKPGNIMLLGDGTVKLFDFGLARAASADASVPAGVVGTIAYMSPEQLRNEPVDARADLWALGVILYEMLCGSRPFVGDGAGEIVKAVLESEPRPLDARGASVPAPIQNLVNALLAKEPRARIQSAEELSHAIGAARRRLQPAAWRRLTKGRIAVAAGALAGMGLLAGALWLRSPATLISSGKLAWGERLVLADFQVSGLDPGNAPALNSILRRDFADTKAVSLLPANGLSSELQRMRRPAGTPITPDVAREIAQRQGLHAVLGGSVSRLATGYLVTLRVTESQTGNELASSSTAAAADRDLLPALARTGQEIRRAIGESPRGAQVAPTKERRLLTTTSLEAARLMLEVNPSLPVPERIARARAAVRLDSTFAYAWSSIGNMLAWSDYRSAALDSAFSMAYRFRDNVTLMERAQVSGLYWWKIQRDRRSGLAELESALALDSTIFSVVPLNILETYNESRQFERSEAFARRIERWKNVGPAATGALVHAQVAQGKYAAAESSIARLRAARGANDRGSRVLERLILLSELRFDSAEVLLEKIPESKETLPDWIPLYRLRGRLDLAHRLEGAADSASAAGAVAAGARFDSTSGRALIRAREALWLDHDAVAAVARLDERWRTPSPIHDSQDRIDGIQAAALYAAAGRAATARALLTHFESGADTIAKRAIYEYRQDALAEIALADGRFNDAMAYFRAGDLAADGLPVSTCSVCIFPNLARVAERAGWSDSARVFWEAYVSRPAIDRLSADQWFLADAYSQLAALAARRGDAEGAARYRRALAALHGRTSPRG